MIKGSACLVDENGLVRIRWEMTGFLKEQGWVQYNLFFERRGERGIFDQPWRVALGNEEPVATFHGLQQALQELIDGDFRVIHQDTFQSGFTLTVEEERDETELRVELWADLGMASPGKGLKPGMMGERQVGLQFLTTPAALGQFRFELLTNLSRLLT